MSVRLSDDPVRNVYWNSLFHFNELFCRCIFANAFFSLKRYFRLQIIEQRIAANLGVNFLKNLQIVETA